MKRWSLILVLMAAAAGSVAVAQKRAGTWNRTVYTLEQGVFVDIVSDGRQSPERCVAVYRVTSQWGYESAVSLGPTPCQTFFR